MRYLRTQGGFTLVELVIVLALTSLAVAGVLAGTGAVQNQTAFSSAINATRNQLKGIQNQASQAVADSASATGQSAYTTFGKLVEFDNSNPTAQQMKTWTLIEDPGKTALYKCDEQDSTLPQGVSFQQLNHVGSNRTLAIVFGRDPQQTYLDKGFTDNQIGAVAQCNPGVSPTPVAPTSPSLCVGFVRTLADPLGSCPASPTPPPPATPPPACDADPTNWQCGLFGQYYSGSSMTAAQLSSAYIDQEIGENMGSGGTSNPTFTPTLSTRAQQTPTAGDAVHWSGQILIGNEVGDYPTPQPHQYCFDADAGSAATITVGATNYNLTNNYGSPTPIPKGNACATIQVPTAGWYPIDIKYATVNAATHAHLYEPSVFFGANTVPENDLRTAATNAPFLPSGSFVSGLYGQYYSDTKIQNSNRVSAYTDPLIGDGGSKFSFSTAKGFTDDDSSIFVPTLKWNTASNDASDKAVEWTGQVKVDTSGIQTYCTDTDDGSILIINDDNGASRTLVNDYGPEGHTTQRRCGTINLSAGWHNIQVNYENVANPDAVIRLIQFNPTTNVYTEVPHDHLRRPLDWSATGDTGTCSTPSYCVKNGNTVTEDSSSTTVGNSCGNSDHKAQITYTKSGLPKDGTYNLDINYFNSGSLPPPSGYSYLVCVTVNGKVENKGLPMSLPISVPGQNPRTVTLSGVGVPASGTANITLDWLNDSSCIWLCVLGGGSYDSNLGITRLDLYRNLKADGSLTQAAPSLTTPQVASAAKVRKPTNPTIGARLARLFVPSAYAANGNCDDNILDPTNYNATCFAQGPSETLVFQVNGYTQQGYITVSTQDNSIERSFP